MGSGPGHSDDPRPASAPRALAAETDAKDAFLPQVRTAGRAGVVSLRRAFVAAFNALREGGDELEDLVGVGALAVEVGVGSVGALARDAAEVVAGTGDDGGSVVVAVDP